jgi:hypothetical protein
MSSSTERQIFDSLIDKMTTDFVGREWLFAAIGEFFAQAESGYFVIRGEPGVGKTAALAEFVKRTGCLAYFNITATGINRPTQFIDSICSQLRTRFVLEEELPNASIGFSGEKLQTYLDAARAKLDHDKRLLIAVDAIDEVDSSGQPTGSNILYLPHTLPQNVFFILTCRPMASLPLNTTAPVRVLDLSSCDAQSAADIDVFLRRAAEKPAIQEWLIKQNRTVDEFVRELSVRSELNFVYLRYVLGSVEAGDYRTLDSATRPIGLQGYYENLWQRMGMTNKPLPHDKIRLLYILSEAPEPISRELLADFAGLNVAEVQAVIDEWQQFLVVQEKQGDRRYQLFHQTFREFLRSKEILLASGITIESVNRVIADNLWLEVMGDG